MKEEYFAPIIILSDLSQNRQLITIINTILWFGFGFEYLWKLYFDVKENPKIQF